VVVHTVGHSTRTLETFLAILHGQSIAVVADVRRFPKSRRHPHFGGETLARSLEAAGLRYAWIPQLGGRRTPRPDSPHTAWREPGFRGYADHLATPEFAAGLARLLDLAAAAGSRSDTSSPRTTSVVTS
jgi:uncharacterized protein (DUF488 family)